jgi:hypothetical protein
MSVTMYGLLSTRSGSCLHFVCQKSHQDCSILTGRKEFHVEKGTPHVTIESDGENRVVDTLSPTACRALNTQYEYIVTYRVLEQPEQVYS